MKTKKRIASRWRRLTDEVTALRGRVVEQEIYSTAKDEAVREYVNKRIAEWNAAIRASNGIRRGETMRQYQARLVKANEHTG